jgi:vesicle coat complex subunit
LKELQIYIKDNSSQFVCTVIRCIGRVCDADPDVVPGCLDGLMHLLICSKSDDVISQCVITMRQLLQQSGSSPSSSKILHQLVKMLIIENGIDTPSARTSIVWLVGEFIDALEKVAPDILRLLAVGFTGESVLCKMQILNLAIKLVSTVILLHMHCTLCLVLFSFCLTSC